MDMCTAIFAVDALLESALSLDSLYFVYQRTFFISAELFVRLILT